MIIYFVEIEKKPNKATPFNLLPEYLAYADFAIDMASILPSSPLDLSAGWVRTRHLLGFTPPLNLYDEKDIKKILKIPNVKDQCKIFIASKEFSIDLIEKSSTQQRPSIVLTDNKHILDYFYESKNAFVLLCGKDEPTGSIWERTYLQLVKLFSHMKEQNFSRQSVSEQFGKAFCFMKTPLDQTQVTSNLLCRANEIILAQTRGKIPHSLEYRGSEVLDTDSCYSLNKELAMEIFSERLLDLLFGIETKEVAPLPRLRIPGQLHVELKAFLDSLSSTSPEMIANKFFLLRQKVQSILKETYAYDELTIVIPTVNHVCREGVLSEIQRDLKKEHRVLLEKIVDALLLGGRRVPYYEDEKYKELSEVTKTLVMTRQRENTFLTALSSLIASRKLSPVLKTLTAPSSLFLEMNALGSDIGQNYLSQRHNPLWGRTIAERLDDIRKKFTHHIPACYLQTIEESNPSELTFLSDIPFELAYMQGSAICQSFPTTRMPITPLGALLQHYNHIAIKPMTEVNLKSTRDVLVVNSLMPHSNLFPEFELFRTACQRAGLDMDFNTVKHSDEFIKLVNSRNPKILAYFGHANYNVEHDKGELVFDEDRLSYEALDRILGVPPLVLLIGCETGSSLAFSGGLSQHLLMKGTVACLATLFPIPANQAALFLGRILAFAKEVDRHEAAQLFSHLVLEARKVGWLADNVSALEENEIISLPQAARIIEEAGNSLREMSVKRGESVKLVEAEPVLRSILKEEGVLEEWESLLETIVPYSLFFTLLGSGHTLFVT